jgi:hypothetical protein
MLGGYKVSLISTSPSCYALIAIGSDGKERTVGRYQTLRRAELRMKRLEAVMAAEVECQSLDSVIGGEPTRTA